MVMSGLSAIICSASEVLQMSNGAKEEIGGRAYSNGLRLMNSSRSVKAYYNEEGHLKFKVNRMERNNYLKYIKNIPLLRGAAVVIFSIFSFLKEIIKEPLKYWFIILIILLDIYILSAGEGGSPAVYNLVFLLYIMLPILLIYLYRKKISEVRKYHGAEHMAVNYYENNFEGEISDYSRIHKRCGSNLVFYYLLFQLIGALLGISFNILLELLLYLGLAYEAMLLTPQKMLPFVALIQRFMTKDPDQKQLKAAEAALKLLTADEELFS